MFDTGLTMAAQVAISPSPPISNLSILIMLIKQVIQRTLEWYYSSQEHEFDVTLDVM